MQMDVLVQFYQAQLLDRRINDRPTYQEQALHYCEDMLSRFPTERPKADRWLGFIQGVLWATGVYTVDEMREHNKDIDISDIIKSMDLCNCGHDPMLPSGAHISGCPYFQE